MSGDLETSKPQPLLLLALFGFATAFIAGNVASFFAGALRSGSVVAMIAFAPICEELARGSAFVIHRRYQHFSADRLAIAASVWGVGYGSLELVHRWPSPPEEGLLGFLGPLAPFTMHIMLSAAVAKFVFSMRAQLGMLLCAAFHALYNAHIVLLYGSLNPDDAGGAVLITASVLLLGFAAVSGLWPFHRPPTRPPPV